MQSDGTDIHDRHSLRKEANDGQSPGSTRGSKAGAKPKTTQAIRDAHFFEDNVKANGSGGKSPQEEQ